MSESSSSENKSYFATPGGYSGMTNPKFNFVGEDAILIDTNSVPEDSISPSPEVLYNFFNCIFNTYKKNIDYLVDDVLCKETEVDVNTKNIFYGILSKDLEEGSFEIDANIFYNFINACELYIFQLEEDENKKKKDKKKEFCTELILKILEKDPYFIINCIYNYKVGNEIKVEYKIMDKICSLKQSIEIFEKIFSEGWFIDKIEENKEKLLFDMLNFLLFFNSIKDNEPKIKDIFEAFYNNIINKKEKIADLRYGEGWNLIHFALYYNSKNIFTFLYEKDPTLIMQKDKAGHTPLFYFILYNIDKKDSFNSFFDEITKKNSKDFNIKIFQNLILELNNFLENNNLRDIKNDETKEISITYDEDEENHIIITISFSKEDISQISETIESLNDLITNLENPKENPEGELDDDDDLDEGEEPDKSSKPTKSSKSQSTKQTTGTNTDEPEIKKLFTDFFNKTSEIKETHKSTEETTTDETKNDFYFVMPEIDIFTLDKKQQIKAESIQILNQKGEKVPFNCDNSQITDTGELSLDYFFGEAFAKSISEKQTSDTSADEKTTPKTEQTTTDKFTVKINENSDEKGTTKNEVTFTVFRDPKELLNVVNKNIRIIKTVPKEISDDVNKRIKEQDTSKQKPQQVRQVYYVKDTDILTKQTTEPTQTTTTEIFSKQNAQNIGDTLSALDTIKQYKDSGVKIKESKRIDAVKKEDLENNERVLTTIVKKFAEKIEQKQTSSEYEDSINNKIYALANAITTNLTILIGMHKNVINNFNNNKEGINELAELTNFSLNLLLEIEEKLSEANSKIENNNLQLQLDDCEESSEKFEKFTKPKKEVVPE